MATRGAQILFVGIALLVFPGIIFNVFAYSSGLNSAGAPGLAATAQSQPDTVQGQVAVGCQVNAASCDLSTATICIGISNNVCVLSPSSAFTFLFAGNLGGFLSALTNPSTGVTFTSYTNGTSTVFYSCTDTGALGTKSYGPGSFPIGSEVYQCNIGSRITPPAAYTAPVSVVYTNNGTSFKYQKYTCALLIFACGTTTTWFNLPWCTGSCNSIIATGGFGSQWGPGLPAPSFVQSQTNNYAPAKCTPPGNGTQSFTCVNLSALYNPTIPAAATGGSSWIAQVLPGAGFIFGLFLLILSVGIGITLGGLSFSAALTPNSQGTKLAQTMGITLVIWSVLYSEFGSWFTSGVLPLGLDGVGGIISLAITSLIFFGFFDQLTQGTAPA